MGSDGIDAAIDAAFRPLAKALSEVVFFSVPVNGGELPLIVVWLIAGALFFTFYFRFISLRGFGHVIRLVRGVDSDAGRGDPLSSPDHRRVGNRRRGKHRPRPTQFPQAGGALALVARLPLLGRLHIRVNFGDIINVYAVKTAEKPPDQMGSAADTARRSPHAG